jgi:hypothetical protein
LPNQAADFLDLVAFMFFRLGGVVLITPLFLLPGVVVGLVGACCGQMYIRSQLSVKREFPQR